MKVPHLLLSENAANSTWLKIPLVTGTVKQFVNPCQTARTPRVEGADAAREPLREV